MTDEQVLDLLYRTEVDKDGNPSEEHMKAWERVRNAFKLLHILSDEVKKGTIPIVDGGVLIYEDFAEIMAQKPDLWSVLYHWNDRK